jgi:hypothetical protein
MGSSLRWFFPRSPTIDVAVQQAGLILLALTASTPAMIATGYVAAWITNLAGFRQRSLIERIFWSVPLSFAITPIVCVLLGDFFSLTAAAAFLAASAAAALALLAREWVARRRQGSPWVVGWKPLGEWALALAAAWVVLAVLSLVDFESGQRLYLSTTLYDHSYRVAWTEAILRSGVPPANPLYRSGHAAPLRTYYFWYAVCAAVARLWQLPARCVFLASCIWAGFGLAAVLGLYLKHFLAVGHRLRRQFLVATALLAVTGLDLVGIYWEVAIHGMPLPPDLEWWSRGQIASWLSSLLWVPHHVASLVCCMLVFLLANMAAKGRRDGQIAAAAMIALAVASAFGVSIYVTFAFFLTMVVWAVWHLCTERTASPVVTMTIGGVAGLLLLAPYLQELRHAASGNSGDHVFSFAVREMIPPEGLLRNGLLAGVSASHPDLARNLANLALLAPGYLLELGFYLVVLLAFLLPAWHGRRRLTKEARSLLVIAVTALVFISGIRSWVLATNDFGWRAALFVQFPLVLLASELFAKSGPEDPAQRRATPGWLRMTALTTLWAGLAGTACQALALRFYMPFAAGHDAATRQWVHEAWVARRGYAELQREVPADAVVQYNPRAVGLFGIQENLLDVDHPTAMFSDRFACGSLWGGDPAGCPAMSAALEALFAGATADQTRAACERYGIDVLIARSDDAAWKDRGGWVWTLPPVVNDAEFRALRCGGLAAGK